MTREGLVGRLTGVVAQRGGGAHSIASAVVDELERMGLIHLEERRPGRVTRRGAPRPGLRHQVSAAVAAGIRAEVKRRG